MLNQTIAHFACRRNRDWKQKRKKICSRAALSRCTNSWFSSLPFVGRPFKSVGLCVTVSHHNLHTYMLIARLGQQQCRAQKKRQCRRMVSMAYDRTQHWIGPLAKHNHHNNNSAQFGCERGDARQLCVSVPCRRLWAPGREFLRRA